MRVFCLLILTIAWCANAVSHDEVRQLRIQLENLREKLNEAEHLPGQEGVNQVLYYEKQLEDTEKKMDALGISLDAEERENAPWNDRLDNDHIRDMQKPDRFQDQAQYYARQIAKINREMALLSQEFDQPNSNQMLLNKKMHSLLQKKVLLEGKMEVFRLHPAKYWTESADSEESHMENKLQQNADSDYVALVQEQLQTVYDQIFSLKESSAQSTSGAGIKDIGLKIAKLENEEKKLKQKLRHMGATPERPKILTDPSRKDRPIPTPLDHFLGSLKTHISYLDRQIEALAHKVQVANSGHEMVQLGTKMDHLQIERHLLSQDLKSQHKKNHQPEKSVNENGASWGLDSPQLSSPKNKVAPPMQRNADVSSFDPKKYQSSALWKPYNMQSTQHLEDEERKQQRHGSNVDYKRHRAEGLYNMLERKHDAQPAPQTLPFSHWN